ncbi:6-carboxytetrahydropterin synthase [Marinobacterium sp. YM272]|uniref:6-carboxytetrahydropterin synthase n=1 Tax=Marinobacterium sp. YM272 TaxID=3421654 RepID=UPI003D7F5571
MKLFVENLTHVDFSYLDAQRGLLGESWAANLILDGSLDNQGMICDFGVVKKRVKQWLDAHLDHCLVVAREMAGLESEQTQERTAITWTYPEGGQLHCSSPAGAITLVPGETITPEALALWCREQLLALFPEQVKGVQLEFVPEVIEGAYYHYSHGLQQHEGNCQRIAHGHRSRIQVLRNGARDSALEARWAETFRDIYIGTRAHLKAGGDTHHYVYDAPQGHFELSLPARCCYDIDTESTVEQIAQHLAGQIKAAYPQDAIEVRAFEGIGKGAIATA